MPLVIVIVKAGSGSFLGVAVIVINPAIEDTVSGFHTFLQSIAFGGRTGVHPVNGGMTRSLGSDAAQRLSHPEHCQRMVPGIIPRSIFPDIIAHSPGTPSVVL